MCPRILYTCALPSRFNRIFVAAVCPLGRCTLDSRTAKCRCFANGSGESVSFETRNPPPPPRTNYDTTEIFGVTCSGISPQKFLRTPTWIPPTTSKTFDRQARLALNFHFVFNRDFHRCGGCGFPSGSKRTSVLSVDFVTDG